MAWREEIFDFEVDDGSKGKIVVLNIGEIDSDIEKLINDAIVSICFGDSIFTIEYAKKYIKNYLNTTDPNRKKGAISEFFVHLYLKSKGLKQECIYTNMEENSPKKGFDEYIQVILEYGIWKANLVRTQVRSIKTKLVKLIEI